MLFFPVQWNIFICFFFGQKLFLFSLEMGIVHSPNDLIQGSSPFRLFKEMKCHLYFCDYCLCALTQCRAWVKARRGGEEEEVKWIGGEIRVEAKNVKNDGDRVRIILLFKTFYCGREGKTSNLTSLGLQQLTVKISSIIHSKLSSLASSFCARWSFIHDYLQRDSNFLPKAFLA